MSDKKKSLLYNEYILSVATKIITASIGFISSAFSTRYLGVQYKGDFAYITQIANIAMLILNLGIYQSYSYNYKKYGKETLKKYNDICFLQFMLLTVLAIVLSYFLQGSLLFFVVILVPFNILKIQYENIVLIENIKLRMRLHIFNSVLLAVSYICLYLFAETKLEYVVCLTVIVDVITVAFYSIKLKIVPKVWEIDFSFFKTIIGFGFIPMLSALLATINYSIDIVFLKHIGIAEELSYYALASNIINYVWMIPDAFKDVLFSKSAKKFDKDSIMFSSRFSGMFILACFIGFAVLGKILLSLVYGKDFVNSYWITLILIIGAFSMSVFKLLGIVLVSQGRRNVHFISLAISALVNIVLNILLIPHIGMYGAGIASVSSYTVCAIILMVYFCRLYEMTPVELLVPSKKDITKMIRFIKRT